MSCDCQSFNMWKCPARSYHISLEEAKRKYGACHCDCHEDENGNQITQVEWKEAREEPETIFTPVDSIPQEAQRLREAGKIVHDEQDGVIVWSEPEEE